nr:phosphatase PAP2 family protein [Caldilineaceae bacterium]
MDFLHEWVVNGFGFVESLQGWHTPLLDLYFRFATFLGVEEFFLLALPAILWLYNKKLGRRLVYLLIFTSWVNESLKNLFQLPRPSLPLAQAEDVIYGLPSGHAQNGAVLWGYAGLKLRGLGPWVLWLAVWIVLSIAFSRLYLGVHYPMDVLAGLFVGTLLLAGIIWAEPRLARWYGALSTRQVALFASLLAVLMLALHPTGGQPWPLENIVSEAGLLIGGLIGLDVERRRVRFSVAGSPAQKIGRYLM